MSDDQRHTAVDELALDEIEGQSSGAIYQLESSKFLSWLGGKEPTPDVLEEYCDYAQLDRNKWSHDIPSGFHFPNPGVQQDYTQIWNGDFLIQEYQPHGLDKMPPTLSVGVSIPSQPSSAMIIVFCGDTSSMATRIFSNELFEKNTSETMKLALAHQVLHHFMRQRGSFLEKEHFLNLVQLLRGAYMGTLEKPWKHMLDLAVTKLDVCLSGQPKWEDDNIAAQIHELAGNLQATGNNLLAAHMFTMAATKHSDRKAVALGHFFATQCYQRGKEYAKAENSSIKALHATTSVRMGDDDDAIQPVRGVLSDPHSTCLEQLKDGELWEMSLAALLDTYSMWHGELKGIQGSENEVSQISLVYHTFLGLLSICELVNSEHDSKIMSLFIETMLKRKFKKKSYADTALKVLMQCKTAQTFRAKVLSCLKSPTPQYVPLAALAKNYGLSSMGKKGIRFGFHSRDFVGIQCTFCGVQETVGKQHNACPCGSEKYCNRQCQLAHWKQHKRFCSHAHQQKMEKEKASKK